MCRDICAFNDASASPPELMPNVILRTDMGLSGGVYTLSLEGAAGAIKIWATGSPGPGDSPLLACGQTVTDGANGADFAGYPGRDLYVEAVSNGTARLTYVYAGTGDAAGISCSAALKMTAYLPKVELLVADSSVPASALQVAKWENAFSNVYVQVSGITLTNAVFKVPEFISADAERFRVRVTDDCRGYESSVTVRIATAHPSDTAYDAPWREMTLPRVAPGVFVSTNLLLVSDWEDATFDTDAYGVAPNSTNRLFLSQLGSRVRAEYADGWCITNTAGTAVGVDIKTVKVDVAIMKTNGTACIDTMAALAQVTSARERLAQANVNVEMGALVFFDAPPQVDVDHWHVAATNDNRMLSPEARSVIHEAVSSVTNGDDNICLIFVPRVRSTPTAEVAGHATASYWYAYPVDAPYTDHCLISVNQIMAFVSAHEMCHALDIRTHETEKSNLMFPSAVPSADVDSSKRLKIVQIDRIRSGGHVK